MWIAAELRAAYSSKSLPSLSLSLTHTHTHTNTHTLAVAHTNVAETSVVEKTAFVDSQCEATRDSQSSRKIASLSRSLFRLGAISPSKCVLIHTLFAAI